MEMSNASCENCGGPANVICICQQPLKCFCDGHIQAHISKNRSLPHYSIPASYLGAVPGDSAELLAFRSKQILIDEVRAKLATAGEEVGRKRKEAERVFDTLRELVELVRTEYFEEFDERARKIGGHIANFERAVPSLRFNLNYPPSTLLEHYISTQDIPALESRPFEFLKTVFTGLTEIKQSIEDMGEVRTNEALFGPAPVLVPQINDARNQAGNIFPLVTSTKIVLFRLPNCADFTEKEFNSRHRPRLDEYTQIILIAARDLFCAGGKDSNLAYTIKATNGFVQQEASMAQKRGSPGLAFAPPFLYVFGGSHRSTDHRSCERYNLTAKAWFPIGQMINGRSCFTPCAVSDRVFLFGGGPSRPEYYLYQSDACYALPFSMPSNGPAISFIRRGEVLFICGQGLYRFRNNGVDNLNKECRFEANSHIVPVEVGQKIYFSDWTTDIKLISLDLNSLQWQLLAEHPAGSF